MTDTTHEPTDDLVKRLANAKSEGLDELCWEASDRIEELEKKLARAVAAIEQWANHDGEHGYDTVVQNLLRTLAALKGQDDE